MTTHRNLKRLVRERAARTGESYTTARRNVLAKAAARPGLVPGYGTFGSATGGEHHESTLLARMLQQAGHQVAFFARGKHLTTKWGSRPRRPASQRAARRTIDRIPTRSPSDVVARTK